MLLPNLQPWKSWSFLFCTGLGWDVAVTSLPCSVSPQLESSSLLCSHLPSCHCSNPGLLWIHSLHWQEEVCISQTESFMGPLTHSTVTSSIFASCCTQHASNQGGSSEPPMWQWGGSETFSKEFHSAFPCIEGIISPEANCQSPQPVLFQTTRSSARHGTENEYNEDC